MNDIPYRFSAARKPLGRRVGWLSPNPARTRRDIGLDTPTSAVWTPSEASQFDALVAACALVAYADGWITPEERDEVRDRLRRLDAIALFGIEDALAAFEQHVERFERDLDDGVEAAEAAVQRLAARPGPAHLLVVAACAIAGSDGGFDEAERETILRLCDLLEVDPASFGLVAQDS